MGTQPTIPPAEVAAPYRSGGQLELSFDAELPPADQSRSRQIGDPYYPFDADQARQTILEQLREAGGKWVGNRAIFREAGMRPSDVAFLACAMAEAGEIEVGQKHWPYDQFRIMERTK